MAIPVAETTTETASTTAAIIQEKTSTASFGWLFTTALLITILAIALWVSYFNRDKIEDFRLKINDKKKMNTRTERRKAGLNKIVTEDSFLKCDLYPDASERSTPVLDTTTGRQIK